MQPSDIAALPCKLVEVLLPLCPFVGLDPHHPGVQVPEFLRQEQLVLRIGRDPAVLGMPDLVLDARGFSATISVKGALFPVSVPWAAVRAVWTDVPGTPPVLIQWPTAQQLVQQPAPEPPADEPGKVVPLRRVK